MTFPIGNNSANYNGSANWNGTVDGNVTTVGSNGGPSAYGTFDQNGNVWEWNDLTGAAGSSRGIRGGAWYFYDFGLSSSFRLIIEPSSNDYYFGFRVASILNPLNLINFVLVGDANNSADSTGYGSVNYDYYINQYSITNCEYAEFLNFKAKSDPYSLYSDLMALDPRGGISRFGTIGNYTYSVKNNMSNKPVIGVDWFDCARYCNWLHNEKANGDTETGAYSLNGITTGDAIVRNSNAKYHIPTENEWYKAAYYKGGDTNAGYWLYATQSDSPPIQITSGSELGNGLINGIAANISAYECPNIILTPTPTSTPTPTPTVTPTKSSCDQSLCDCCMYVCIEEYDEYSNCVINSVILDLNSNTVINNKEYRLIVSGDCLNKNGKILDITSNQNKCYGCGYEEIETNRCDHNNDTTLTVNASDMISSFTNSPNHTFNQSNNNTLCKKINLLNINIDQNNYVSSFNSVPNLVLPIAPCSRTENVLLGAINNNLVCCGIMSEFTPTPTTTPTPTPTPTICPNINNISVEYSNTYGNFRAVGANFTWYIDIENQDDGWDWEVSAWNVSKPEADNAIVIINNNNLDFANITIAGVIRLKDNDNNIIMVLSGTRTINITNPTIFYGTTEFLRVVNEQLSENIFVKGTLTTEQKNILNNICDSSTSITIESGFEVWLVSSCGSSNLLVDDGVSSAIFCSTPTPTPTASPTPTVTPTLTASPTPTVTPTSANCCDWDGNGFINFGADCNNVVVSAVFTKTGNNTWSAGGSLECGDSFSATITCNPSAPASPCGNKWSATMSIGCVTNFALSPADESCSCNIPPTWAFSGDAKDCTCCRTCSDCQFCESEERKFYSGGDVVGCCPPNYVFYESRTITVGGEPVDYGPDCWFEDPDFGPTPIGGVPQAFTEGYCCDGVCQEEPCEEPANSLGFPHGIVALGEPGLIEGDGTCSPATPTIVYTYIGS
jgi:formylglycine-generating enzyme required for sulfatase activity